MRLQELSIFDIHGFAVPILIDFDDTKQIVEMTVVFPPCIFDFGKAYVDRPPDFSLEVLRDWREETADMFDADWCKVEGLLDELEKIGIFYFDANPGNIRFPSKLLLTREYTNLAQAVSCIFAYRHRLAACTTW